jgi:hypothetical protein
MGAKENFRKKVSCVVDGSPRGREHTPLGHTFANSLAQDGERVSWAITAQRGMVVIGADVLNAFAEAKMPADDEFYIEIDDNFRDWWVNYKNRKPIPEGCWVFKVNFALQGHPRAPRLWEKHVHKILTTKLHFKSTIHEPCLYCTTLQDSFVMLLRQLGDFAIAVHSEQLAYDIIQKIGKRLRIRIKCLGKIMLFNGMDIVKTKDYIKIHCGSYLRQCLKIFGWIKQRNNHPKIHPVPYPADHKYGTDLDLATPPETEEEQAKPSKEMGINYKFSQ